MPSKRDRQCRLCPKLVARENRTGLCSECFRAEKAASVPSQRVATDRKLKASSAELSDLRKKYDTALNTIDAQERQLRSMGVLGEGLEPIVIEPTTSSSKSEACPVLVLSDFHLDETVTLAQTNGRNQFNAAIRTQRVERLFRAGLNLIQNHLNPGVDVMNTVVMPLLGDFINNQLHEEATETNNMLPAHAALEAENVLAGGINYFLKHSSYDLIIPCKVGNHGRTTKKNQFATENGHSWEYMIYMHLAKHFAVTEPKRVRFQINDGYHEYLTIHEKVLRLHHGHAINYGGGIGGIFIPAFKAISQWDKIIRADLDIFGHFHQSKDGGKFVSNGSLVGYNSYALSIKADYEPPSQTLLLIDKKRGRTCNWPVLLADSGK